MLPRQQELLKKIIQEYIKTVEPVGSLKLSAGGLSSATIRNEMMALESAGYIYQPHTSAGRVPTEKAYLFYVENFVKSKEIKSEKEIQKKLERIAKNFSGEERLKGLARAVAEQAEEAVILAFNSHRLYFTGLSYLFAKPEFEEQAQVTSVSDILDRCEEVMPRVIDLIQRQRILIGRKNPFGAQCSFLAAPILKEGLFGLLGPMRMDYEKNLGIINQIVKLLNC